ncbi:hypothetical protein [Luteimonas aquatica]|uniref:hypothetical protein n=1 Tax=Luteimonas aquatica TaxID=450364 RepID=UPI001F5A9700|nr:hypothetical protein [Luteimonas aquatica]
MHTLIILLLCLHVLAGVFWAGSTFTLARSGGSGASALLWPQMGAAAMALLTGLALWGIVHAGRFAPSEQALALGMLAALAAAAVQIGLRAKPALSQRVAAGLLALTVVCMAASRYLG